MPSLLKNIYALLKQSENPFFSGVYGPFYLAIGLTFYECINVEELRPNIMIVLLIILLIVILYGPYFLANQILNKYSKDEYFSGNGYDLARLLLDRMNMRDVSVEETDLGDHYDPEKKTVRLSRKRCGNKTLTAAVIAAHEIGHAIQDNLHYKPLYARTKMVWTAIKIEKIGAGLIMFVPLITLVTRVPAAGFFMFLGGLATLCIPIIVHVLTLPTEFDASFNRALPILKVGKYIPSEDLPAARRILIACSLTYVASALTSLLNIWRWIKVLRR